MAGVPPLKGSTYSFELALVSQANVNLFQVNPTLVAGDVQVSKDGGAFVNLAALPTVIGAGKAVTVALSAAEMTADRIVVLFSDQAGAEWQDKLVLIETDTLQISGVPAEVKAQLVKMPALSSALKTGNDLTMIRGDTWEQEIQYLGTLTGYQKIWFTARKNKNDTDAQSAFQILLTNPGDPADGLQYIVATAAGTPANGSIVVDDLVNGHITVTLEAVEAAKLVGTSYTRLAFDVQFIDAAGDIVTPRRADLDIISDVTRATS